MAVGGEKSLLSEVFGGDCERFHRMRAVLDQTDLSEVNQKDQRWDGFRKAVDTVEEVLKSLGVYRTWLRGPPEQLSYAVPELLEPGVVVHFQPEVEGNCALSSLCFSVTPDLPQFLVLDSSGGELRGRPKIGMAVPRMTYTLVAGNNFGSAKAELTFAVQVPAPESVSYAAHKVIVGKAFRWEAAHQGGKPTSFEVQPELPKGIDLDAKTGEISGVAVAAQEETVYKVTASNDAGVVHFDIPIRVLPAAPSGLSYPDLDGDFQRGSHVYLIPEVAMASAVYDPETRRSTTHTTKQRMLPGAPKSKWGYSFSWTGMSIGRKWGLVRLKNWENIMLRGCAPKLQFTVEPELPAGLHMSATTGTISGMPTAATPKREYKVTAWNESGKCFVPIRFAVLSVPPRCLSYDDLPATLHVGEPLSCSPVVEGFVTSFSVKPPLPPGLILDTALGTISGSPVQPAAKTKHIVEAENEAGSTRCPLTLNIRRLPPSSLVYSAEGIDYPVDRYMEIFPVVEGDVESWSVKPDLPPGLTLNTSTGKISGTPTQVAPFTPFVVTASNESGDIAASVGIEVKLMPPSSLRYPGVDDSYGVGEELRLEPEAVGGVATWSIEPALPPGVEFDMASGVVFGAPTAPAPEASYTITASNEAGGTSVVMTFEVLAQAPQGLSYSPAGKSYTVGAPVFCEPRVESGGEGSVYKVSPDLPEGLQLNPHTGTISGSPAAVTPAAEYTATATNRAGSAEIVLTFEIAEAPKVLEAVAIDQMFAARVEEVTHAAELPAEPEKARRLGDWMIWMVHRAWINDPTLEIFDFSCLKMPLPHMEPRVAPKLCKALATNTRITSLLLPDSNFRAPQAHQLGESLKQNKTVKLVNIESNHIDSAGLKAIAIALKESKATAVETLRLSNQIGGDLVGRPVEQAMAEMLQAQKGITRLGFVANDAHWADCISRSLLRNVDEARRLRKGHGLEAAAEVNRAQRPLRLVELQSAPDKAVWEVYEEGEAKMDLCRLCCAFVAEKRRLPPSQHLQGFAKERGLALGYSAVAPLLRDFARRLFDASVGCTLRCEDDKGNVISGTLSAWSEKNGRWSLHVDTLQEQFYDFRSDKAPNVEFSDELVSWISPRDD